MMPMTTKASAFRPSAASSCPTWGPTNSVRRNSTSGEAAFSACSTCSLCCAEVLPCCTGRRISTSREVPKFCTWASPKPSEPTVLRTWARSAVWL